MIAQLTHNWLCWAIVVVALVSYHQLWLEFFKYRSPSLPQQDDQAQREFSGMLIAALPLMGLLGTIIGLLDCFAGIASQGASSEMVSGGIADALLTTQLGLVCAIPGWLLQSAIKRPYVLAR